MLIRSKPWNRFRELATRVGLRWTLSLLFLIALAPRLLFLNDGFFHHDAILMIDAVQQSVAKKVLVPFLDGRYAFVAFNVPFYLLANGLGLPVDLSINAVAAVVGSIAVVLLYLITLEAVGDRFTAAAAALLFAFMPVYFSESTHTSIHPFSACLALLSFHLLTLGNRRNSSWCYAGASVALVLGISARFPNVLLIPSFVLVYLQPRLAGVRLWIDKSKYSRHVLAWSLPLLLGLGLIYYVQREDIAGMSGRVMFVGPFSPILKLGFGTILTNMGILGCLLAAVGLGSSFTERRRAYFWAFALWFGALLLFYGNVRVYADRFYAEICPLLAVYLALGIRTLRKYSKIVSNVALCYLIVSMFAFVYPLVHFRHSYSGQKEYALWVKSRTEPDAVVIAMDDGVFIRYYGERRVMDHPQGSVELAEAWASEVKGLLRKGTPVYIMGSGLSYDPGRIIEATIYRHFEPIHVGSHPTEAYHRAAIRNSVYDQGLFRLVELNRQSRP